MEPVGLAVGVLGLAGLFSTCLDAIGRFESWRNFADESQLLRTLLEGQKLLLEHWGREVGLDNGTLSADHHEALNDPKILSTIRMHLSEIEKICSDADGTFLPAGGTKAGQKSGAHSLRYRAQPHSSALPESRRQKMKWAFRDKAKFAMQAETLMYLVQALRELVPLNGATRIRPPQRESGNGALRRMDDSSSDKDRWTVGFEQILATMKAATRKDVHAWLLGPHVPDGLYEDAVESRLNGTFDWILTQPMFLDWISPDFQAGKAKILWINGAPGCGKTILCARIVEHLRSTLDPPPAHFFFSFDNQESRRDPFVAVRSWLTQVLSHPVAFELVKEEWESQDGQTASRADVLKILRKIVRAIPNFTLVLDGLDECDGASHPGEADRTSVVKFLETIQQTVADTTTRVMIVSRNVSEIRQAILRNEGPTCIEYKLSCDDVQQDIELYARSIVDKKLHNKDETVKNDISLRLAGRCNGQFLWIKLQEPALRSSKNKKQLEASIDRSPTALNHLYERDWQKLLGLPPEENTRAICLLRWAAFALRPLTVAEVTAALLINDDCVDFPIDELPDSIDQDYVDGEILRLCGSLVEIRSAPLEPIVGSQTVHLAHFSVKEFFVSRMTAGENTMVANERLRNANDATQNSTLAMMCLRYVNFRTVWSSQLEESNKVVTSFLNYAAGSWYKHAAVCKPIDSELIRLTNEFFDGSNEWHLWRKWYDKEVDELKAASTSTIASPLYYAAQLCLTGTVSFLVQKHRCSINKQAPSGATALVASCSTGDAEMVGILLGAGADTAIADNSGWTPLHGAAEKGHVEVVKLLLGNEADVTAADSIGRTPLHAVASNGHVEVVKLLLEKGGNVSSVDKYGQTPLHEAARKGHVEVVKLLYKSGADVTAADSDGWTPLNAAAVEGYVEVVKLLLKKGGNISSVDKYGRKPLHEAAREGHVEVVKLLYESGADVTAADSDGWTPLNAAAGEGHVEVVKLLLEKGADVSSADNDGTPLHAAAGEGHVEVVKLLLEKGADVSSADKYGQTPFYEAAREGHVEVVKLLLEKGADVTAVSNKRWSPFYAAASSGHVKVVKLLLEKGADVTAADSDGRIPFLAAALHGHIEVVKLLLEKGADVTAADSDGRTPLLAAALQGHIEMVKLLLEKGADVTAANSDGWTPLHGAAGDSHVEVVKLLLKKGADVNSANKKGQTPLHEAAREGHVEVVKLLLEKGADVMAVSNKRWSPLHEAAGKGHVEMVKMLLEKGADVTAANSDGWTPLHGAAGDSHVEVVKLLLKKGADVNSANKKGQTPLHEAARDGHVEVVKLLLEKGADVMAVSNKRWSPLHEAAGKGHVEMVKMLLEKGADVTAANSDGWTPLHGAAGDGQVEVVKLLLKKGADVMAVSNKRWSPLHGAAGMGHVEMVKMLLEKGADVTAANSDGWTPLHGAAGDGHVEVVKLLLKKGADVMAVSNKRWSPLHGAAGMGHVEMVKLLLEKGADVMAVSNKRWSPLHGAAGMGHVEMVKLLLEKGADATAANDDNGGTPLHGAASNGHMEVAKLLLEKGADVMATDRVGWTPLYAAAKIGHIEVVKLLMKKGADVTTRNDNEWTPLHAAASNGHVEVAKLLLENGADDMATDCHKWTPLHVAACDGHVEVVKLLLEKESLVDMVDGNGRSPFFYACARGRMEVIEHLLLCNAAATTTDRYGATPLFAATRNGHEKVVTYLLAMDCGCDHFVDGLDRTLQWWAAKSGNAQVIEAIVQLARKKDIEAGDNDLAAGHSPTTHDESSGWCDCCTRYTLKSGNYFECPTCQGGEFNLCVECHELGARCHDGSHDLVPNQIQAS